jgi:hypothetical protein
VFARAVRTVQFSPADPAEGSDLWTIFGFHSDSRAYHLHGAGLTCAWPVTDSSAMHAAGSMRLDGFMEFFPIIF